MWRQTEIRLRARSRGFHLITDELVSALPDLASVEVGLLHLFLQHTSAALTINENADPTVRGDFERWANQAKLTPKVFMSEDAREGAAAFAEKRAPNWKGK